MGRRRTPVIAGMPDIWERVGLVSIAKAPPRLTVHPVKKSCSTQMGISFALMVELAKTQITPTSDVTVPMDNSE